MKKTVLITGASRGIGKAIALELSRKNYNIVVNYNRSKNDAIKVMSEISKLGTVASIFKCDISDRSQVENMFNFAIKEFGKIDILINNAGISYQKLFTDITLKEWKKIFEINVEGIFNCSQYAVKNMLKYHKGKIINISSIWGLVGASCEVHYSATKAAIIGFTKALAKELGPSNIQVNCVAPGVIDTNMNKMLSDDTIKELENQTPLGRIGSPNDIAKLVSFLSSEDSNFITGQIISPNGGIVI